MELALRVLEEAYRKYTSLRTRYLNREVGPDTVVEGGIGWVKYTVRPSRLEVRLGDIIITSDIDHDGVMEWIRALRWALGKRVGHTSLA